MILKFKQNKASIKIILTGIVLFFGTYCFAQEMNRYNVDSLAKIGFKPWHLEESNEIEQLSRAYIQYGMQISDNQALAHGLYGMSFSENFDTVIKYSKKLVKLTENKKASFYYTLAHSVLGTGYYNKENAELALKAYSAGYDRSKEINDILGEVDFLNSIGAVKGFYGKQEEAIVMHHKALYLTRKNKKLFKSNFALQMLFNYENIALHHLEQRFLDSAFYYINLARIQVDIDEYPRFKDDFKIVEAQTNYYAGNYLKCKTVLDTMVNNYEGLEKADILYFIAKSEEVFGNIEKRDSLLRVVDSIMIENPYPVDNTPEVYSILLRNAIKQGDKDKQLDYLEKLIYFDSLIQLNQQKVKAIPVDSEFTLENLKQMREDLNQKLDKRSYALNYTIVIASLLFLGFGYYIFKYKKTEKRLQEILRSDIKTVSNEAIDEGKKLEPVMNNLLNELNKWERNLGFLDRTISQKTLAQILNTNDTYLSKLVNEYKQLSFSNYIKDLRITYCINDLREQSREIRK